jgi:hypothetical protein
VVFLASYEMVCKERNASWALVDCTMDISRERVHTEESSRLHPMDYHPKTDTGCSRVVGLKDVNVRVAMD